MLKGKAKIELFDKDGNRVYVQEKDNIITDAYKNLINPNFVPDFGIGNTYRFNLSTLTPLVDKLFGGIIVFAEQREANVDNFMITKEDFANYVGSAGGTYSGNSIYKGSLNASESGKQSDKEYKLVWDFPSNACNGKISNIGLCPRYLGNSGLIKDENDTATTSLLQNYGDDMKQTVRMYKNSYGIHHFHRQAVKNLGYYVYSKDANTNVYAKLDGKVYTFTEVTKTNKLGLMEAPTTEYASNIFLEESNLYKISAPITVDYSELTTPQIAKYLQYSQGYIYFLTYTNSSGTIVFNVHRINAKTYEKEEELTYTFYIGALSGRGLYSRYINNKIYITSTDKYLYICDLSNSTFKSIEIPYEKSGIYFEPVKFYDTVMLVQRDKHESYTPVYVLDANDNLCFNMLYFDSSNGDYAPFGKINTDDECLSYPLANASSLYYYSSENGLVEYQNQILMPFVCSINNVDTFYKNSSNTMKITYYLKEY